MKEIIESVKTLIAKGAYSDALDMIGKYIPETKELSSKDKEDAYAELITLRISANSLLGQKDNVILDHIRREKYLSEETYVIDGLHKVTLISKNLFLFKCDAMINTIHVDKLFDISERSASKEYIDRLGRIELNRQIQGQKPKLGDFIKLNHPKWPAPTSYHIVCYYGTNGIDYDALAVGIKNVLKDTIDKKLTTIGSFPLGYGIVGLVPEAERMELRARIADKVGEAVFSFLWR